MPTGAYYPAGVVTPNDWDTYDFDTTTNFAGITDFSAATQAAIDAASVSGTGGDVYLPPGVIRLNGVTINAGGVNLIGCGWEEYTTGGAYPFAQRGKRGTYVITDNPAVSTVTLGPLAANNRIGDIAFLQPHEQDQAGWSPSVFQPTLLQQGPNSGSLQIERILLWGCYDGIKLGTVSNQVGRTVLRDIYCATYNTAINVANCPDILTIDNCNFYPQLLAGSPNIQLYMRLYAIFVALQQCAKPVISNVSAKNCMVGVQATSIFSQGGAGYDQIAPQRIKLIGADFDGVQVGVQVRGSNTYMKIIGMTHIGASLARAGAAFSIPVQYGVGSTNRPLTCADFASLAIDSAGANAFFDIVDLQASTYEGSAIVVEGLGSLGNDLRFGTTCWFDNWNNNPAATIANSKAVGFGVTTGQTFPNWATPAPAITAIGGDAIFLPTNCRFTNANGGGQTGGGGTFTRF